MLVDWFPAGRGTGLVGWEGEGGAGGGGQGAVVSTKLNGCPDLASKDLGTRATDPLFSGLPFSKAKAGFLGALDGVCFDLIKVTPATLGYSELLADMEG